MSEGSCGSDAGALASRVSRARLLKRCEEDLVLAQAMEMAHAEAVHAGSGPAAFPSPILVTGSSGLLGAALVTVLRGVGVSVRRLDVLAAGTTDVQGSVVDAAVVERAVQGARPSSTPRRCTTRTTTLSPKATLSVSTCMARNYCSTRRPGLAARGLCTPRRPR